MSKARWWLLAVASMFPLACAEPGPEPGFDDEASSTEESLLADPDPEPGPAPELYDEPGPAPDLSQAHWICQRYAATSGEKVLVLDLSDQWMWACQGTSLFLETRISTGKPGFETPTGTYYVNSHLKGDQMVGWYSPTDYYDEWVPWVSYFTNVGHAVHQGDASRPFASHGCVRVPYGTAETLWWWVDMWLRIEIVW